MMVVSSTPHSGLGEIPLTRSAASALRLAPQTGKEGVPDVDMRCNSGRRGTLQMISPLVGEMSAKLTEGDGDLSAAQPDDAALRDTPVCPAGHLPHKGGDHHTANLGGSL